MLGFFVDAGDIKADKLFSPYLVSFKDMLKKHIGSEYQIPDLKLILIQYHVEGEFLQELPKFRVISYRAKEKSIAVSIPVTSDFANLSDVDRKKFIVESTIKAVDLVYQKYKNKLDGIVILEKIKDEVIVCANTYYAVDL